MFVEINKTPHQVEAIFFYDNGKRRFRIHASHARAMVFNNTTYVGVGEFSEDGVSVSYARDGITTTNSYSTLEDALFWTAYNFLNIE